MEWWRSEVYILFLYDAVEKFVKYHSFFRSDSIIKSTSCQKKKMKFLFRIIFFTPYFKKDGLFQTFFSSNIFSSRKMKCAWYTDDEFLSFLEQEHLFRKLLRKLDLALMKIGKKIFSKFFGKVGVSYILGYATQI